MSPIQNQNYDSFSEDYDRFVNWKNRLNFELPFLLAQLSTLRQVSDHPRILDAACGTGMHALALAKQGYQVTGSDFSPGMVARARKNAIEMNTPTQFEVAGFGELQARLGNTSFDSLLCLGNSLPHLLTPPERTIALRDFASCLVPGGLLILQNRNFDAVMATRERTMEPVSHFEANKEWVFLRFYEFRQDGLINFNIITLYREDHNAWQQSITTTSLLPLLQHDLIVDLSQAGFEDICCYGSMDGSPFDPASSGNLVVTAWLGLR